MVVQRVLVQKEPLLTVVAYVVSHETIRRIILYVQKHCALQVSSAHNQRSTAEWYSNR